MNNAPGKGLLKVTGILMIIFAAISIIVSIVGVVGAIALASLAGVGIGFLVIFALIIALAMCIIQLLAGIFGVKHCNQPEKANVCFGMAIVIIVLNLISNICGGFNWTSIFSYVLPILYLIGAVKNKNANNTVA